MRLIPRSIALKQVAIAESSATSPHSVPPMAHVPSPILETSTPAIFVVSMQKHLKLADRAEVSNLPQPAKAQVKLRFPTYAFLVNNDTRRVCVIALISSAFVAV